MKLLPYESARQVALFDREANNLKDLSWKDEKGCAQSEAFAPTFYGALREPEGASKRRGRLFMRYHLVSALHCTHTPFLYPVNPCVLALLLGAALLVLVCMPLG